MMKPRAISSVLLSVTAVFFSLSLSHNCCNGQGNVADIKTVYLVLMVPYPDPVGRASFAATYDDGHDISPAAYLAVEQINNRTDILKGYKLELIQSDGGCSVTERTVYSFARDIVHGTVPLAGIIGPSCDVSAEFIAQLTSIERVPLISLHYGGGPAFLNYTNTFGVLGPDSAFGDAFFELIVRNNWKRIAILHLLTDEGLEVLYKLLDRAKYHPDFQIAYTAPLYDTFFPLQSVKELFIKVIFLVSSPELSRRLLCLAFHHDMIYPNYQWIFETHLDSDFYGTTFSYDDEMYRCSAEEIFIALRGSLNFFYSLTPNTNATVTFSGLTYPQYLEEYNVHIQKYTDRFNVTSTATFWANPVYDATWTFALALNYSLEQLEDKNLSLINNHQEIFTEIIQKRMFDVHFQGITGEIAFDTKTRFLKQALNLFQYDNNDGKSKKIGAFKSGELLLSSSNMMFVNHSFPVQYNHLRPDIAALYLILAVVALLLAIPAQVVNVVYRKHKSIKATSPKLNHIVFVGCYLVILGIVLHTFSEMLILNINAQTVLCNLFPCTCSIGLTLVFATVCVRTWRLHYIFMSNGKPKKHILIKDKTLGIVVGVFVLVETIVAILWMAIDPLKAFDNTYFKDFDGAVPVIVTVVACRSSWALGSLIVLGIYKALLLFLSLVFAILNRKIYLKDFETKNVIVLVYLLSAISAIGVPVYLIITTNSENLNVHFVILSSTLFIGIFICLVTLFLPPIIPIIREKYGNYHKRSNLNKQTVPVSYYNNMFEQPTLHSAML